MFLKKKKVLLVYENTAEINAVEEYLSSKGYDTNKAFDLKDAFQLALNFQPDVIVVNTKNIFPEIEQFNKQIEQEQKKKIELLNLVDIDAYLKISVNEHVAIKPVQPSLLHHLIRLMIKN
jgi:PleD family two-component response regulator